MNVVLRTEGYHPKIKAELFGMEDFKKVLLFMKKSTYPIVGIIGKNPTAHPNYFEFIEMCIKEEVYVTTRLDDSCDEDIIERLAQIASINNLTSERNKIDFIIDLTNYSVNNSVIQYSVKKLGMWSAGTVVLSNSSVDMETIYNVVYENKMIPTLLVSLPLPIPYSVYRPINKEEYESRLKLLMEGLDFRRKNGISLVLDCGIPACDLSKELIGNLYMSPMGGLDFKCFPKCEVLPGLKVAYCGALAGESLVSLEDFDTFKDLINYLLVYFKNYDCLYEKCSDCLYKSKICGGGCKGYKINKNNVE